MVLTQVRVEQIVARICEVHLIKPEHVGERILKYRFSGMLHMFMVHKGVSLDELEALAKLCDLEGDTDISPENLNQRVLAALGSQN